MRTPLPLPCLSDADHQTDLAMIAPELATPCREPTDEIVTCLSDEDGRVLTPNDTFQNVGVAIVPRQ